jgi:hypothetical protein
MGVREAGICAAWMKVGLAVNGPCLPCMGHRTLSPTSMPGEFYIDTEHGVVCAKATGVISRADVLDFRAQLLCHPDFRPELNQLVDYREITKLELSSAEVKDLARHALFSADSKRVFVVASDLQFGLIRMFGAYREIVGDRQVMVCRTMAEALSFLSLLAEPDPKSFKRFTVPKNEA